MRPQTLILTQREIARLVTMRTAIRIVREVFKAMARGRAVMPPKLYLTLPRGDDFRAMPAFVRPAACGVKWVNVHPRNRRRGLPTVMAIIVVNDPLTGFPLAVLDGLWVTKLRTAAAAAVAARALARRTSRVVGLIGCGAQADAQVLALSELFSLRRVNVWGRAPREAKRFCARLKRQLPQVSCVPCSSVQACVREADLIVTLTPSRRPLVQRTWLRPGVHINAVGADAPGKQELDPRILNEAMVVVDERQQAIHGGEINVPIRRGQFRPRAIHASLGEILLRRKRSRRSAQELTVFDSTGLAVHDVALAHEIVRQARRRGIGRRVAFF